MSWVVDASVGLAWYIASESTARTNALLQRVADDEAVAPAHWLLEMSNALLVATRRRRIADTQLDVALTHMVALGIALAPSAVEQIPSVMQLAVRHHLSVYDALYLELAIRIGAPLATNDAALQRASTAEGVALL